MKKKFRNLYNDVRGYYGNKYERFLIKNIIWRLQFKKVNVQGHEGRCVHCDGGNPIVECSYFYCPCSHTEHLKRKHTFNWLYRLFKKDWLNKLLN